MNDAIERLAIVLAIASEGAASMTERDAFRHLARAAYEHVLREACGLLCLGCEAGIPIGEAGLWHKDEEASCGVSACHAGLVARRLHELEAKP